MLIQAVQHEGGDEADLVHEEDTDPRPQILQGSQLWPSGQGGVASLAVALVHDGQEAALVQGHAVDVPGCHARRRRNHGSLAALSQHVRGRAHHDGLAAPAGSVEQDAKALQARAVFRVWLVHDGVDDVLHGLSLPRGFRGGIRRLQEIEGFLAAFHGRKEAGGGPCGHGVRHQEVDVGAVPFLEGFHDV